MIKSFSWDWLEISSSFQRGLEIRLLIWVPEDDAICVEITIHNLDDHSFDGVLELVGDIHPLSSKSKIDYGDHIGRSIITAQQDDLSFSLFTSGNPQPGSGPERYFKNNFSLEKTEKTSFRWICRCSTAESPRVDGLDHLLGLDWQGELSKRTIRDQGEIQITTDNAEQDFLLALSQKEGNRIANNLLKKLDGESQVNITPLQALFYIQSLDYLSPEITYHLLNAVYQPESNTPAPPLFGVEFIWQLNLAGIQKEDWFPHLTKAVEWLDVWFSPRFDEDGDHIPELVHPELLGPYLGDEDILSRGEDFILPYPHLESPGLAAVLYNELQKLEELDPAASATYQRKKESLLQYLENAWNNEKESYQYRDSWSHLCVEREQITEKLMPGLNIIRKDLSVPSRIGILSSRMNPADNTFNDQQIYIHGLDWTGNYRIEVIEGAGRYTYGLSEGIYQRIDYCVVNENIDSDGLSLHVAGTNRDDLTLALPFWADACHPDRAQEMVDSILFNDERFLTPFGLRSLSNSISHSIQMSWNLLFGQALVRSGMRSVAWTLFSKWLSAAQIAQNQTGNFFSTYDGKTGAGLGPGDLIDRVLPVRFFLEIAGIHLMQNGTAEIQGEYYFPFPLQVKIKGIEIYRDREYTKILKTTGEVVEKSGNEPIKVKWDY